MKRSITLIVLLFSLLTNAQTYGPNNPTNGTSVAGIGTIPWTNAGNVLTNNATDATMNVRGISRYVQGRAMGFNIPATEVITGIQVDIDKSTTTTPVTILNNWSTAISNRTLSAGTNRCMIVIISLENATARDITSVRYDGVNMIPLTEEDLMTTFYAKKEVWYLMESQLAAIGTGNHDITYTYGPSIRDEEFDIVTSAIYQNVDQIAPFFDVEGSVRDGGAPTYQIGAPINTLPGSMSITSVFCGQAPSPNQALGNCNAFSINSGFTEVIDFHDANAATLTSGGVSQVSHKSAVAVGTEQPTFTFAGTPNRLVAIGLSLRKARIMDNSVRIRKTAGYVGVDKALLASEWPASDTYSIYGGPGDLWGTTWTPAEINDVNFGAGISVNMENLNGIAQVDHIRITVFTSVLLPVEISDFSLETIDESVAIKWTTQSERENQYFIIDRSRDGNYWEELGKLDGGGNSSETIEYEYLDGNPFNGVSYYRLRQVNTDGEITQLGFESVDFKSQKYLLYPIPVNTTMFLEGSDLKDSRITVMNSLGEVIDLEPDFVSDKLSFNFAGIKSGVYFLSIESNSSKTTKKIIVAHK